MSEAAATEGAPVTEVDSTAQSKTPTQAPGRSEANYSASTGSTGNSGGRGSTEDQDEPNVSWQDIKSVQNLIERCLQKFMTQTEIIAALQVLVKA